MSQHSSDPDVQRLGVIVGRWRSEGHLSADPSVTVTGSDSYEWLPGGFFLLHHVDVMVGDRKVQAVEVIGERAAQPGEFLARSFDNEGNAEVMRVRVVDDGVLVFTGGADIAPAAQPADRSAAGAVRSTLSVSTDRSSMTARWERSDDGAAWEPWMDMTFKRVP